MLSDRCLSSLSVTLVYCGQTVRWITMPLTTEVGLGLGDTVLDGDPAISAKGHTPIFGPCLLWPNGWMDQDATWYKVGLGAGHSVLDGDPASSEWDTAAPTFLPVVMWPNSWIDQDATW